MTKENYEWCICWCPFIWHTILNIECDSYVNTSRGGLWKRNLLWLQNRQKRGWLQLLRCLILGQCVHQVGNKIKICTFQYANFNHKSLKQLSGLLEIPNSTVESWSVKLRLRPQRDPHSWIHPQMVFKRVKPWSVSVKIRIYEWFSHLQIMVLLI